MKSLKWMLSYILVASLGLWLAFFMSMKFMVPAKSQEAPSAGDLPPEFASTIDKGAVDPATKNKASQSKQKQNAVVDAEKVPAVQKESESNKVPPPPIKEEKIENLQSDLFNSMAEHFVYDPIGKRDPFKPIILDPNKRGHYISTALEPLLEYDLEQLQIVGILWDINKPRALIRTPTNSLFTVFKNTRIGRNGGYVIAIREGEIVVSETTYEDGNPITVTKIKEIKRIKN